MHWVREDGTWHSTWQDSCFSALLASTGCTLQRGTVSRQVSIASQSLVPPFQSEFPFCLLACNASSQHPPFPNPLGQQNLLWRPSARCCRRIWACWQSASAPIKVGRAAGG